MLSKKTKGIFLEHHRSGYRVAVTSSLTGDISLESLHEYGIEEESKLEEHIDDLLGTKGARFVPAHIGVYPKSRFFRRHTLENPAKAKDDGHFRELLESQFRLSPDKNRYFVLNSQDGMVFDKTKPLTAQKEVLFCGAEKDELDKMQRDLVELHLFPESIQLGTLSTLGTLQRYLAFQKSEEPMLVFEMTAENSMLFIISASKVDLTRPIPFGFNTMFPIVQSELGLKDEESAKKLFFSNTFDFTEMGPTLMRRALKELQASTGFYEVQTGQTIEHLIVPQLPANLNWVPQILANEIGIDPIKLDYAGWLEWEKVALGPDVSTNTLDARHVGLIGLMINTKEEVGDGA